MKIEIWRIYVPAENDFGAEFPVEFHETWDTFVRRVTGGVTIMKSAKGQWVSPTGRLYIEKMIPCEIMCTKKQMQEIIDFTRVFYGQEAVLAFRISNEVILRTGRIRNQKNKFWKVWYNKLFKK